MPRRSHVTSELLVLLLILLGASGLPGCATNQTPERSFTTIDDARRGGGFETGWLPQANVPPSGRNLRARRDLRSDEIWARFEFDPADRAVVSTGCQAVGQDAVRLPGSDTRGIGWWPEMLRGDPGAAAGQFHLFACPEPAGPAHLAVHRTLDTAFFWRVRD